MLRTLSAPQTPRSESEKLIKLKIIQVQVGHECDSSTAIYTHVSDDFMRRRCAGPSRRRSGSPDGERVSNDTAARLQVEPAPGDGRPGMFATTDLIGPLAQRKTGCRPARSTGWSPGGPNASLKA